MFRSIIYGEVPDKSGLTDVVERYQPRKHKGKTQAEQQHELSNRVITLEIQIIAGGDHEHS